MSGWPRQPEHSWTENATGRCASDVALGPGRGGQGRCSGCSLTQEAGAGDL